MVVAYWMFASIQSHRILQMRTCCSGLPRRCLTVTSYGAVRLLPRAHKSPELASLCREAGQWSAGRFAGRDERSETPPAVTLLFSIAGNCWSCALAVKSQARQFRWLFAIPSRHVPIDIFTG